MTIPKIALVGAGSLAFAASALSPIGFGHRPRFFFQAPGEGGDGGDGGAPGGEIEVSVDSAFDEAFAEVMDTNPGGEPARDDAAAPTPDKNTRETPAAGADKAPATPDHWSTEEQAAFDALPPETKSLVEKRIAAIEADYNTKTQENQQSIEMANGLRSIVDETGAREVFAQSGMNEVEGVRYLANLERFAREKPADYLRFVAQHVQERFGLNPAEILGMAGPAQPDPAQPAEGAVADPRVDKLMERLDAQERDRAQATMRRVYDDAGTKVDAFRNAKDEAGNLLHPHLADVESAMARLMMADPKLTLDGAYEAAVWGNPTVRAKLQASEREAVEKRAREEGAAARKAIRSNIKPGSRTMAPSQSVDTVDDAVSQAFAEINR